MYIRASLKGSAFSVRRGARIAAGVLGFSVFPRLAVAAGPTPAGPLVNNNYVIEFYQGPLIAPIRVSGLAGAYNGYAEGVEGTATNAASPGVREPFSLRAIDYDVTASISLPGSYANTDFDNRGQASPVTASRFSEFLYLNLGAQVQYDLFGASITGDLQQFNLASATADRASLTLRIGRFHALGAYGVFNDQLVVGAGLRVLALGISENGGVLSGSVLTMTGTAPEIGALVKPDGQPWRIGVTARAPVTAVNVGGGATTTDAGGVTRAGNFIVPQKVVEPWELEVGVALQAGPRPLNPTWLNPEVQEAPIRLEISRARAAREAKRYEVLRHTPAAEQARVRAELDREEADIRSIENQRLEVESQRLLAQRRARYANWPREKLLFVASALVTGPDDNAIAVESFLDQKNEPFGQHVTVMPRFGVESEPIVDWVRVRAGVYVEPSRFESGTAREHFTTGADFKLFPFDAWGLIGATTWRVSMMVDAAPRYFNWGFGIGAWH